MVSGGEVQGLVYEFMLRAFAGDAPCKTTRKGEVAALDLMLANQPLCANTVAAWPIQTRACVRAWLTRLLVFVSLFPDLQFPADFLSGSSSAQLGEPVIAYIRHYQDALSGLDPAQRTAAQSA